VTPRRVVVTGLGAVTAIGQDVTTFWESCLAGNTVVERIPESWHRYADYFSQVWSPLPEIDYAAKGLERIDLMQSDPVTTMAVAAATEAVSDSAISLERASERGRQLRMIGVDPDRIGVSMGTGLGGTASLVSFLMGHTLARPRAALEALYAHLGPSERAELLPVLESIEGPQRVSPLGVAMIMPNAAAGAISIRFSTHGPAVTATSACAAGTVAVGNAFRSVRAGTIDVAITGGSEFMHDPRGSAFRSFDVARTLATGDAPPDEINRPFDRDRTGFLFSQGGAAVLVLEELEHARRRGASLIAEVVGFAETSDAHNPVAVAEDGYQIERALRDALGDADLEPADVDYVNAHGTGTMVNDEVETAMLERVVGKGPIINSTKSLIGHTLGASGAIEAVVTALSIRDQATHACRNLNDPIRDLSFVRQAGEHRIRVAVSESFAFGGHNAALVMKEVQPEA
jgi:3-oxoacyl-[acyl-carrier-protein] synthase II